MRTVLLFLLRLVVSVVLAVFVSAVVGFVISFVGVFSLKAAGFANIETYSLKFQYLSMALGNVVAIPLYISIFRSQFPKKIRFFAAAKSIGKSLLAGIIVISFALFVLEGLIGNTALLDPVRALQIYFMLATAALCFWSGYLTLKYLPDGAGRQPISDHPDTITLFKFVGYCFIVMILITPIVAYQGYLDVIGGLITKFNPAITGFVLRQPTIFLSLAFMVAVQLLFIIMICQYRSRFARNLYIAMGVLGVITAPVYWYILRDIELTAIYLVAYWIILALFTVSLFLILTPSARAWINHDNEDAAEAVA